MARTTKENIEELNEKPIKVTKKKATKIAEKLKTAIKSVAKKEPKLSAKLSKSKEAKTPTKKSASKKATLNDEINATSEEDTNIVVKETITKKHATKKAEKTTKKDEVKKTTTKKTATKKDEAKKTTAKKSDIKKAKKADTKKDEVKKTTKRTAIKKDKLDKKTTTKSQADIITLNPLEYYDLPYRYNQTVVKVLAQNPNTLFVYWDIADSDRENFEKNYGKLFFYNTRPVLVIHNLTDNYTFEIDIDDFANNWYVNVNDSKCKYVVELGRRPKYEERQAIPVNYINVEFSNTVEIPNDHIIFFHDNDKIYFKNIKTNKITEKIINIKSVQNIVKRIYKNYNLTEKNNRFDFNNPSSQNPSSTFK